MQGDLTTTWTRICDVKDVAAGECLRVEVDGFPPLVIFNLEGEFFVTADTCTHGDASLSEGFVDGDEIECPWHAGRFCIRTGEATGFPAVEALKVYAVTVSDDAVMLRSN
ncbi:MULTISPECIES: non-heme iron oxygenase ferredoxin subunit [Burkholderia]|uniref:Biphenyl dioxygenase system ferredoxin subunit n=1 Tax=Burkholderia pseudomultivorans TaxID=1207504 RepID=A0ABU2EC96_9BURK|nr:MULTISPECIES: non-heme iron oxygenase ferredoxin subunit [Burkholderia]MDR8731458.1 Biphenyl dioxygenase system ferredoxin subunit [Burkholderia pseudomultivorans]MDR8757517.1 Biphenyl dioxygenase system ferredoxin subunit [Burkholderia pseudomultivorans]MDR8781635.1 Biphenyl dioxygenase system ferredoxin subunit [Burkholderia pseudomultivorans]MDR8821394.1 Biphenyl dioxygenase system ferredoxin subunit [Burkholderia pseudomultivorans]MDR8834458.1 Biphenyl dioxygenase system ferredoxin subu